MERRLELLEDALRQQNNLQAIERTNNLELDIENLKNKVKQNNFKASHKARAILESLLVEKNENAIFPVVSQPDCENVKDNEINELSPQDVSAAIYH